MFSDPISALTALAPLPEHDLGYEVLREFDDGLLESMVRQGLLQTAPTAEVVPCGACDEQELVSWAPLEDAQGGIIGIRYTCEMTGTEHEGPVAWIRRYRLHLPSLAAVVGTGLGSRQQAEEIEPGVYKWPRIKVGATTPMLVLARGLTGSNCLRRWTALGLSAQAIVIGIGPTPTPPEVLAEGKAGAMHLSIWELVDVDDAGQVVVDRERFEQEVEAYRSGRVEPRKPTSIEAKRQTHIGQLLKELGTRLADARRALLDKDGAHAEALCRCLRRDADLAHMIGVDRSTLHRWRHAEAPGMDRVDCLVGIASDLEALRNWQPT
jgi:hypothetical protein